MVKRALIYLSFMILLIGCINDNNSDVDTNKINIGDALPKFSVVTSNGIEYNNETLLGRIGVIVFFYTPCTDCKQALPIINEMFERCINNEDIRWICIGRSESADAVASYWETNDFSLPYSAQADRSVYSLFANSGIPRIYITNPLGIVCAYYDDSSPLNLDEFEHTLLTIYSSSFTF